MQNFEGFLKEKYKETKESFVKDFKGEDIHVTCAVLQAWIVWQQKQNSMPATIRSRFYFVKSYLYDNGIEISQMDTRKLIKLPKKSNELMQPLEKDQLRQIIDIANPLRKALYLVQSSSGARIGELCQLRKKDIDTNCKRWIINIKAETTKTKAGRQTFMSKESMRYLKPIITKLKDNDLVFSKNQNYINAESTEQTGLCRILERLKFTDRYSNGNRKISSHAFRAYFFTHAVRINGENYAHKLTGHGGYLQEYDRMTTKDKLELYLKLEPHLLVYENFNEDLQEVMAENQKLKKKYEDMEDRFGAFASMVDERLDISTLGTYEEYKSKIRAKWGSSA